MFNTCIRVTFKCKSTLRNLFTSVRTPREQNGNVKSAKYLQHRVYIKCNVNLNTKWKPVLQRKTGLISGQITRLFLIDPVRLIFLLNS